MNPILTFEQVSRVYTAGDHELRALDHVDLSLPAGKFIVVLGPSGAGKSTLLNLIGGLDSPTEGTITVDGQDISKLSNDELAAYRAGTVGFVFQNYNLIPTLTVYENVALVREIVSNALPAEEMLKAVGLADHLKNFPAELSGGEQQRVSIARALAKNPKILLCDEPTGALDYETGKQILVELEKLVRQHGKTVVIVTHTQEIGKMSDRVIKMRNGKITQVVVNDSPEPAATIEW